MTPLIPGQRWFSSAEPQLGLGCVVEVEFRRVTILFPATEDQRVYAIENAPIVRAQFGVGERLELQSGQPLHIVRVEESEGLFYYHGDQGERVCEIMLASQIAMNGPIDRLFQGQFDRIHQAVLRQQNLYHQQRLAQADTFGLGGGRTSLLPHQLYVAHEVASRFAPRVLLADEVGLGKTIEAGMILHHQIISERARRVLIVVPESLIHQWLIEMRRRFNLAFTILDEQRCNELEQGSNSEQSEDGIDATPTSDASTINPFQSSQLVLTTLGFLCRDEARLQQAQQGEWDLLVVDEAHHLDWSPEQASPEYLTIESLAQATPGVLLLTATPEQLGLTGHFARLRLLDPQRFADLTRFIEEEQAYRPVADLVQLLLSSHPLTADHLAQIQQVAHDLDDPALIETLSEPDHPAATAAREQLLNHLVDRHGTGRVLFRNTRSTVKGFPARQVTAYPLPLPEAYLPLLSGALPLKQRLIIERSYSTANPEGSLWTRFDPRVNWLYQLLEQRLSDKVLLITATAESAIELAQAMHRRFGLLSSLFHEGMSLIERDRSAAFFADPEDGTQLLICSEIGSEGRNFQFAHHLVLFDLPLNPDLLEQRIGRLDRIGQQQTISIHCPYLQQSPQQTLFRWYHEGLNGFEHPSQVGHRIYQQLQPQLEAALLATAPDPSQLSALIQETQHLQQQLQRQLQNGRDQLLEYNSCRPAKAQQLITDVEQQEQEPELLRHLEQLCDTFGVNMEDGLQGRHILRPNAQFQEGVFPGLDEDGMTITCLRQQALTDESIEYLSWEHPMVQSAMEVVSGSEIGNCTIVKLELEQIEPGSLLLEMHYILEPTTASRGLARRYLPPTTIRVVVDQQGNDHHTTLSADSVNQSASRIKSDMATQVVRHYQTILRQLAQFGEQRASPQLPLLQQLALNRAQRELESEAARLRAMQAFNPNVREEEIQFFEQQWQQLQQTISQAKPRLDSVRVIITT